jgi:hypothetical protein
LEGGVNLFVYTGVLGSGFGNQVLTFASKRSPVTIGEAIVKVEDLVGHDKPSEKTLTRVGENLVKGKKRKYRISVA